MGIKVALRHISQYNYDRLVQLGPQIIRLRPAVHCRTPILSYSLNLQPKKHFLNWMQDPFGNFMARAVFPESTKFLHVEVDLIAEIHAFNPFDFFLEDEARQFPFTYSAELHQQLLPYFEQSEHSPLLQQFTESIPHSDRSTIDYLVAINQRLNQELGYLIRMEPGVQSCEETLRKRSGSCRDMAWLLCQILRHLGLATRFTSGYLIQLVADEVPVFGPKGPDHDFADLHAWTEVYLPGAGWVGFDPTSGLITGEGHIPLCATPSPSSAAPITGKLEACQSSLEFSMQVSRLYEPSKSTKPFTDYEWQAINQLAHQVDHRLEEQDVRLTMGGEPTFVSDTSRQSQEWHLAAQGPEKLAAAKRLLTSLSSQFAPKGILHHGQGKWYPGEPLPRWSLECHWRKDGLAIADKSKPDQASSHPIARKKDIESFLARLCSNLGLPTAAIQPAYEDAAYYLWKEQRLPISEQIAEHDLVDAAERKRLQRLIDDGLNEVAGWVLPLMFSGPRQRWISNRWRFRSERLILGIGDSPIGLRLPLSQLPHVEQAKDEAEVDYSPFEELAPLPTPADLETIRRQRCESPMTIAAEDFENDPNGLVWTALSVEIRDGILIVFMPPTQRLERWLDLIHCIAESAAKAQLEYQLEGYPPPHDRRMNQFKLTPDPGVLEVNVQPAANWQELKQVTETLYEQAKLCQLSPYKFSIDGQKVGSGGGNHIVLGGQTPSDSPFLRRPDLLRSLITYWQHHPSLSYLFSGLYIGPTSQAPRIDEARHESLYELEIAFQKIKPFAEVPLWMVDRLFRNLLVDLTGNTHRAEFCIDKLYSPEGNSGRLGLVELRNFEMPPHPQMSLLQTLLVRALISRFWETPYEAPLKRWSTALHDRFMLSHFIWEDFSQVMRDLQHHGYEFERNWFEPHREFRFPKIGTTRVDDLDLELRCALEPWPVMGEEQLYGGVARAVDATVERLELKVQGILKPGRYLTCNGYEIPLSPTADIDTHVAGIRFKAWQAPSSYHPHLACHGPLHFDVFDTHLNRSIGGFTYYISHPGGRSFDEYPVNEQEAEGRRLARFRCEHSPIDRMKYTERNPDFPCTLDLRRLAP